MRHLLVAALLMGGCAGLRGQEHDVNVNGRYTVESVDVVGLDSTSLSRGLRQEMQALVGERFDDERVDRVLRRLVRDFPEHEITRKLSRGAQPGHVRIVFEVELGGRRDRFDLSMQRGLYHSRSGWTGELEATVRVKANDFTAGIVSDGDRLLERFAGITARYENHKVGTTRVRLAFDFESLHQIWNRATLMADPSLTEIYRTRQNFQPALTVVPARGLKLTAGASFQRFQKQFPAAHTEAANAVIGTLRYERQLESSGPNTHRLGAGYGLRAATRSLDSNYVYARHAWDFDYSLWRGPNRLALRFTAGTLAGRAPLFDRFLLGNSTTLRGWNKFDIAPAGGDHAVHNSVDYRYRAFRVFYDTGAVWSKGQDASGKHSAGLGLQIGDFAMLVAFPIKSGRVVPVFMAGLNL